jgi:head-tail adaptor
MGNEATVRVRLDMSGLDGQLRTLEVKISGVNSSLRGSAGVSNSATSSMIPGISAVTAAWGLAGAAAIKYGKDIIQASNDAAAANRQITSSATGAGIVYSQAADGARKLGEQLAISNSEAQKTYSSLITLTKNSGQTGQLNTISQRFADVAAAKGLKGEDISTLVSQLVSGQDEALNRLGLKDPSGLYKDYAASVGRTTDSLSEMEKAQIRVNAVVKLGEQNAGAAAERLKDADGQMATATKRLEDLYAQIGTTVTGSMEFQNFLSTVNGLLKSISINADEVREKLAKGLTPKQIAEEQANSEFSRTLDYITAGATTVATGGPITSYLLSKIPGLEFIGDATDPNKIQARRIEQLTQQNQRIADQQKKQAEDAEKNRPKAYQQVEEQIKKIQAQAQKEREKATEEHAKRLVSIYEKLRGNIGSTFTRLEQDNPFIGIETNAIKAAQSIEREFGAAGQSIVRQLQEIEKQVADIERINARFDTALQANDLRQAARDIRGQSASPSIDTGSVGNRSSSDIPIWRPQTTQSQLSPEERRQLDNLREDIAVAQRTYEQNRGLNQDASQAGYDRSVESAIKSSAIEIQKLPDDLKRALADIYERDAQRKEQAEQRADERIQQELKSSEAMTRAIERNTDALNKEGIVKIQLNGLDGQSSVSLAGPSSR